MIRERLGRMGLEPTRMKEGRTEEVNPTSHPTVGSSRPGLTCLLSFMKFLQSPSQTGELMGLFSKFNSSWFAILGSKLLILPCWYGFSHSHTWDSYAVS